jgi:hypothetical protein
MPRMPSARICVPRKLISSRWGWRISRFFPLPQLDSWSDVGLRPLTALPTTTCGGKNKLVRYDNEIAKRPLPARSWRQSADPLRGSLLCAQALRNAGESLRANTAVSHSQEIGPTDSEKSEYFQCIRALWDRALNSHTSSIWTPWHPSLRTMSFTPLRRTGPVSASQQISDRMFIPGRGCASNAGWV